MKWRESHSVMPDSLLPHGLYYGVLQARILEWVAFPFSRKSFQSRDQTEVSLIAGGFFTSWATRGSPRRLEWVAFPFSRGSSRPGNWTRVSCIAGRFFTDWAIKKVFLSIQLSSHLLQETFPDHQAKLNTFFLDSYSTLGISLYRY